MSGDDDLARWTDSAAADAPWWYWPGWWAAWTLMIGGGLAFFGGVLYSVWIDADRAGTLGAKVAVTGAVAAGIGGIIGHLLED